MSDNKIPAAVDRALGEQSDQIAAVDAKVEAVADHPDRMAALERQVEKLWLHIKHFLPAEGPDLPDHLKDD